MADVICIRCGSRAHTTRDHDEGKTGGVAAAAAGGGTSAAAGKKKKADSATVAKAGVSASVKNLFVHHDKCWSRTSPSPGIPDVIEPPFRMQPYDDPCIASWGSRDECLCKECEKKRKKTAFQESQRKKRIAEKGKYG